MRFRRGFLCVLLALSFCTPSAVFAQLETAVTVGAATEIIKSQLSQMMEEAKGKGDYLIFRLGSQFLLLVDSWEQANTNLLNLAFKKLDKTQSDFFYNLDSTIKTASREVGKNLENSRQIVEQANQVLLDVKFWDGRPALWRYWPTSLAPDISPTGDTVLLRIRGGNLANASPVILDEHGPVTGQQVLKNTELEIEVSLPRALFTFDEMIGKVHKLSLSVTQPHSSFFRRVIGQTEQKTFPVSVHLLPRMLATYKVESTLAVTNPESNRYEREYWASGRGGTHDRCQPPQDGWRIDIASVREVRQWGNGGRVHLRGERVTSTGFCVELSLDGGCGRFGTDPCNQHVVFAWNETRPKTTDSPGPMREGRVGWAAEEPIPLNPNTTQFTVTIRDFTGRTFLADGPRSLEFLSVGYRADTKQLTLRPTIPPDLY